jgi:hypothetical protein
MISAEAHALILRRVALAAVDDARTAWRKAHAEPSEDYIRAAFRACVLATRALRRASSEHPDDEQAMLAEATLLDEAAVGLKARLVRIAEPEPE